MSGAVVITSLGLPLMNGGPTTVTYTVAGGQTVDFSDDPAYHAAYVLQLGRLQSITYQDAGAVTLNLGAADGDGPGVYGIVDWNDRYILSTPIQGSSTIVTYPPSTDFAHGSTATILGTGSLTVSASTSAGNTSLYGFYSAWGYVSFENDGVLTVTNQGTGAAYGAAMDVGVDPHYFPLGGNVVNTGTIQVTAAQGAGVEMGPEGWGLSGLTGSLTNSASGSITAHGGAWAVQAGVAGGAFGTVVINNAGQITAASGSTVGIGANGFIGEVDVTNSGTITADHAIEMFAGGGGVGSLHLTNTGTINGSVIVQAPGGGIAGSEQIVNSGAIHGDVQLLDGSFDSYDGRGGTLSGTLTLAGASETVYLGDDGETLNITGGGYGDQITDGMGADHIQGGSGADIVLVHGGGDVIDGGFGTNTISFQPATAGVTLNLAVTTAQATGGAGSETVTNFQNLIGSTHADHLTGDANNNVIDGGGGDDVIDGGGGTNTISYGTAPAGVTVNLALQGSSQDTGAGHQTLSNFQNIKGTAFADTLTGDANDNVIDGGGGNDVLDGGGGNNTVSFASLPVATNPQNTQGVTVSLAAQGGIQIIGSSIVTLSHFQNIIGSRGDDTLIGDSNDNILDGGLGFNSVSYIAAAFGVTVDLVHGTASGADSGNDTLFNIQGVFGSNQNDYFIGYGAGRYDGEGGTNSLDLSNDFLADTVNFATGAIQETSGNFTQSGSLTNIQTLVLGGHNDTVIFGSASHTVTGGLGADTFVFAPSAGTDVITDFSHAQGDKIDLSALPNFQSLHDVATAARQQGSDTVINLLGGGTLTLQGVLPGALVASDFVFAAGASHISGDFNGDHQADVIFRDPTTGDWGYAAMTSQGYDWHHFGNSGVNYSVAGEGDFNGDGVPDVIFRDPSTGDWGYAAMNASGYTWVHLGNSGVPYAVAGTGDFNGDGRSDVLFRDPSTGDWGYAAMTPQGYNWTHLGNSGVNYAVAGTGDFNGDGRTDALFRDPSTGDWGYAAMTSQGFDWHHFGNSGVNYAVAGTGDFNGDGVTDVLFRDPSTGDWGYAAMSASGFTWVHLGNSGVNYTVGGTGDFNADGRSDVIFRDASTGDWGYAAMTPAGFDWHHEGNSGLTYLIS